MEQQTTVKREFVIDRQGKSFVLYAGLLDLAHSQGLRAIRTRLIQVPAEENNLTAIVSAEVETDRGTFSGIGDASPANVSRMMLTATIRLAETRAKARALRDACNIGVAALEELGDDDIDQHPAPRPAARPAPTPQPPTAIASPREPTPIQNGQRVAVEMASEKQVGAIYSIGRQKHNLTREDVDDRCATLFGTSPAELTRKQASEFISSLQ